MQNKQILSTQPLELETAPARPRPRAPVQRALVFDACHVGVVLRAVLFVEIVLGVGAMYGASTLLEWLARVSLLTGGALPATLRATATDLAARSPWMTPRVRAANVLSYLLLSPSYGAMK